MEFNTELEGLIRSCSQAKISQTDVISRITELVGVELTSKFNEGALAALSEVEQKAGERFVAVVALSPESIKEIVNEVEEELLNK